MAKDKNGTWKYYLGVGLTLLLAGGGIIYSHGSQAEANEQTAKEVVRVEEDAEADIAALKDDGCDPAGKNTTDIAVIHKSLETIQREQEKGFDRMLEAIKAEK